MDKFRDVDLLVTEATRVIRLFFYVSPANEKEQKERFLSRPGPESEPKYTYPPLEFPADELLGRLEDAAPPSGRIGRLYADKCRELADVVRLLQARGTEEFRALSESLFGRPPPEIVSAARKVLQRPREPEYRDQTEETVKAQLEAHVAGYQRRYPDFQCEVVIDPNMSANMYVSEQHIHLKQDLSISGPAAACDRHHEIDAHILTYLNGHSQPLTLFAVGLKGYLAFQESLGVFSEIANRVFYEGRAATLCARVVAVDAMAGGMRYYDVFAMLIEEHGLDQQAAYTICQRVFRGGGFTKDWLYLSKLEELVRYWASGKDMGLLLLGKVTLEEVDTVRELVEERTLRPPRYLPEYLEEIQDRREAARLLPESDLAELFSFAQ
jgi:uncharacterized protein (TIGR02421 family)